MTSKITDTLKTLTVNERKLLRPLFKSSKGNGHDFGFTEDARGVFYDPKTHPGVLASLQEKGIIQIFKPEATYSGTWTQFIFAESGMDSSITILAAVEKYLKREQAQVDSAILEPAKRDQSYMETMKNVDLLECCGYPVALKIGSAIQNHYPECKKTTPGGQP